MCKLKHYSSGIRLPALMHCEIQLCFENYENVTDYMKNLLKNSFLYENHDAKLPYTRSADS